MIEEYFTLRFFSIVAGIGIVALIVLIVFISVVITSLRWRRKISLLRKNGYEQYLHHVPSVGGGAFYGWKRGNKSRILESELNKMSYRQLKNKIKSELKSK